MDQAAQELITRHNEQVRELIVRDIDALQQKLDVRSQVSRKADQAFDKVKGTIGMNDGTPGESWSGFTRHNAVPLLAVGLGGAVLARNLRSRMATPDTQSTTARYMTESSYEPGHVAGESSGAVETAKEKVGELADGAKSTASEVAAKASDIADTAKAKVADAKDSLVDGAGSARETVTSQAVHAREVVVERVPSREQASQLAVDHYQLLGLAAIGAGAVAGTFLPRTRFEERRLAPMQAQVKERATSVVEEGVEKAKETADRAADALGAAAETAREEFSDSTDEPPSGDLPDLTRPNRITGSRGASPTTNGSGGTRSST